MQFRLVGYPPLPAREDIIRTVLQVDSSAGTSDPAWVRVNGPGFSVEINIADKTPLTEFACHVRGEIWLSASLRLCWIACNCARSIQGAHPASSIRQPRPTARRAGADTVTKSWWARSGQEASVKATAAKLLANFERLFVPASETILVDASLCDHAIQAWYDKVTRDLEVEGFQALGDFTSASTIAARKGQRPPGFSRKFLSADKKIRATAIHMLAAKSGQPDTQIVGLNSEFNDGRFLRTTNATEKWDTPDNLFVENLPRETSPTALAGRHRARLASHIASNPDATVVVMQSLQDVFDSESRSQLLTSAFRRRRGIPSIDELVRFGIARQLAQLVHQEMHETKRSAL